MDLKKITNKYISIYGEEIDYGRRNFKKWKEVYET